MFQVKINKSILFFVSSLGKGYQNKILFFFGKLEKDPIPYREFDIKKIKGVHNKYRVRIGEYRIFYETDFKHKAIYILKIRKKKDSTYKREK
ncbi:type II toxin-antitoxin system RelE/ParE family toxin [Candidatus Micrarchaeota archaeon]|nr:type II toxin-antitoxin system RelE/ParE family toxin [Candidatus Micrarchaeota archaeon]